jgi:hypothetical protein
MEVERFKHRQLAPTVGHRHDHQANSKDLVINFNLLDVAYSSTKSTTRRVPHKKDPIPCFARHCCAACRVSVKTCSKSNSTSPLCKAKGDGSRVDSEQDCSGFGTELGQNIAFLPGPWGSNFKLL